MKVPLSSVRDTSGSSDEKTSFGSSLRVIEESMGLRNIVVGSHSVQRGQYNSKITGTEKECGEAMENDIGMVDKKRSKK